MKVIYFAKEEWEEEYIKGKLPGFALVAPDDAGAEVLSVFVNHPVDAAEMAKYPKLKLIATRSTGYDHIDIVEAKKRGVAVATVPPRGGQPGGPILLSPPGWRGREGARGRRSGSKKRPFFLKRGKSGPRVCPIG